MLQNTRALSLTDGAGSGAFQLPGNQIMPYREAVNVQLRRDFQANYASPRICDDRVIIAPPNLKSEAGFPHGASAQRWVGPSPGTQAAPLGQTFPLADSHLYSGDLSALRPSAFCELTEALLAQGHEVPPPVSAIPADLGECTPSVPRSNWAVCISVPQFNFMMTLLARRPLNCYLASFLEGCVALSVIAVGSSVLLHDSLSALRKQDRGAPDYNMMLGRRHIPSWSHVP
jgi:hypothetical protein